MSATGKALSSGELYRYEPHGAQNFRCAAERARKYAAYFHEDSQDRHVVGLLQRNLEF